MFADDRERQECIRRIVFAYAGMHPCLSPAVQLINGLSLLGLIVTRLMVGVRMSPKKHGRSLCPCSWPCSTRRTTNCFAHRGLHIVVGHHRVRLSNARSDVLLDLQLANSAAHSMPPRNLSRSHATLSCRRQCLQVCLRRLRESSNPQCRPHVADQRGHHTQHNACSHLRATANDGS